MTKTRNLVLAAAALMTLGAATLSSNEASAYGFRYGGFHHYGFGSHIGYGHFGYRSFYNYRYSYRWPVRHYIWRPFWRPRVVIGAPIVRPAYASYSAPAYAVAPTPIAPRPPCLLKQYTPEGAVVFADRCTQETAVNPPPQAAAGYEQPAPQAQLAPQPQSPGLLPPYGR